MKRNLVVVALAGLLNVAPAVQAQEADSALETRLQALEQRMQEQQSEFEAQRERLERTVREQQKNLEARQATLPRGRQKVSLRPRRNSEIERHQESSPGR